MSNSNNSNSNNTSVVTPPPTPSREIIYYNEGVGVWIADPKLEWVQGDIVSCNRETGDVVVRVPIYEEIEEDDEDHSNIGYSSSGGRGGRNRSNSNGASSDDEDGEDGDGDTKRDEREIIDYREVKLANHQVFMKNPDIMEGIDDLAALSFLHEAAILHNLHHRYNLNQIYTYIGQILIAINPYTSLPLYGKEMINAYYGKQLGALSPHVYAVAENVFKETMRDGSSQSILVSGESGAGKTETTKFLLQYFAAMGKLIKSSQQQQQTTSTSTTTKLQNSPSSSSVSEKSIEERVLESTPLLEAFGNAKTLRNDNSSRFGKFIEIHFNEMGMIIGTKILTYLLEKSRIVRQVYNERNYHIFYQLLAGADDELKELLYLKEPSEYYYLNQSQCFEINGVDDKVHFNKTCHAMTVAGITKDDQEQVFKILSIVLMLGNIVFKEENNDSSSVDQEANDALQKVSELLGCKQEELEATFTTRKVVTGKDVYTTCNTKSRSENARDSMSMLLYGLMFDWLVLKINQSMTITQKSRSFIGILDIYGFESFEVNGFEQFCINYANEKLQQVFNQHVFKEEQQEYIKEKIDWSYIDFNDNQDVLDLIEKKGICILSLLDEESMFPKATSQTFATKLYSKLSQHPKFEKPRFSSTAFTINHYAGKVTYETDQFLDKNKDFIIPEQISLLQKSQFGFIKTLFKVSNDKSAAASQQPQSSNKPNTSSNSSSMKFSSVGSQFSTSLATLMKTIASTTPHYIRCIKPNPLKRPQTFNKTDVIHQLRCGGVMESVRICCQGFPTRRLLSDFYSRYKILYPKSSLVVGKGSGKSKEIIKQQQVLALLQGIQLSEDQYKIGITKVFLRAGQLAMLENMRLDKLNHSALAIQTCWRRYHCEKQYVMLKRAAITLQTSLRGKVARGAMTSLKRHRAATIIQSAYRGYKKRTEYNRIKSMSILLQCSIRKTLARHDMQTDRLEQSALVLQTAIRSLNDRVMVQKRLRGIVRLQAKWRGKMARKVYRAMVVEARSLRTVQEAKNKLQEKLEEIQWRLTTEQRAKQQIEEAKLKLERSIEELQTQSNRDVQELGEVKSRLQYVEDQLNSTDQELTSTKQTKEQLQTQYDQLQITNQNNEKQRVSLQAGVEKLQGELDSTTMQLTQLRGDKESLDQSFAALKKELQEKSSQLVEKTKELDQSSFDVFNLRKNIDQFENDILNLENQRDTLESSYHRSLEEIQSTRDEFETKLNESNEKYNVLQGKYQQLETSNGQLQQTSNQLKLDLEKVSQQLSTTQSDWKHNEDEYKLKVNQLINGSDDLKLKLSQRDQSLAELQEKYKKLKGKLEKVEQDKAMASTDNEKMKMLGKSMEDEKTHLNNTINSLKEEREKANQQLSQHKEKISTLKSTLNQLQLDLNRIRNDISSKDEQSSRLNQELAELRATNNKQSRDLLDLQSQTQIEKSKYELTISTMEKSAQSDRLEIEKLQFTVKQGDRDLVAAKDTITKCELEIKNLTSLKERFESEFFVAKEKNSSNAQESMYLKEVTNQMQQNQSRLEGEVEEKKQQLNRLEDEKDSYKKQTEQLTIAQEQLKSQLTTLQSQLDDSKVKREKSKDRLEESDKQINQLQLELVNMKQTNQQLQSSLESVEKEKIKIKEKSSLQKQSIQQLKETNIKLDTENVLIKKNHDFVESTFVDMKSRNKEVSELLQLSKNTNLNLESEIERITSTKNLEIENMTRINREAIDEREKEVTRLKQELSLVSVQVNSISSDNQEIQQQLKDSNQKLEQQLLEAQKENETLRHEAFEEKKSRRKSVEIQQGLEEMKLVQNNEIQTLQKTIGDYQQEKSSWEMERDQLMQQLAQLKQEREQLSKSSTHVKELELKVSSFKELEDVINDKETDWERLARAAGNQQIPTKLLSDYLLSCKLEHSTLAGYMWFHQLVYWRAFEKDKSPIFNGIARSMIDFSRRNYDNFDLLSYLLSCSSLLLYVFQNKTTNKQLIPTIPTISELNEAEDKLNRATINSPTFIDQLQQSVGRSYGLLFRIVIAKLHPLIEGAILNENYNKKSSSSATSPSPKLNASSSSITNPLIQLDHVTSYLFSIISIFQQRMLHFSLSELFFNQIFCWIGVIITRSFMLRQIFCTESFALHLKTKVDLLVRWANDIGNVWVGNVDNAFVQVREVIAVLLLKDKEKIVEEKIRKQTCPTLNPYQLRQILTMFTPAEFGKRVSAKTIQSIVPQAKSASDVQHQSFVIDDSKLSPIPIKELHYFENVDIQSISIPPSIKHSIDTEIQNIVNQLL